MFKRLPPENRQPLRFERNRFIAAVGREEGYRRALKRAGYTPGSVDLAVERDREWIERGGKR